MMSDNKNLNPDEVTFRRRDMLEAEKVAKVPFGTLFVQHNGEQVATALGAMAMQYVMEKRSGLTEATFDEWLDEDADDVEFEAAPDPS